MHAQHAVRGLQAHAQAVEAGCCLQSAGTARGVGIRSQPRLLTSGACVCVQTHKGHHDGVYDTNFCLLSGW
jgi:hypothetical protein